MRTFTYATYAICLKLALQLFKGVNIFIFNSQLKERV